MSTVADCAKALASEFRAVGIYRTGDNGTRDDDFPLWVEGGEHGTTYTGPVCVYANNSLRSLGPARQRFEGAVHTIVASEHAGIIDWINNSTDAQVLAVLDSLV